MAKKATKRWLSEHISDTYVKQANRDGFRSRAAYKLKEIDQRDNILPRGGTVLDLGAAPGGWSQVAAGKVGSQGYVLASDILPMDTIAGVEFIQGDIRETGIYDAIAVLLKQRPVDLVMSDIAPNLTGIRSADQAQSLELADLVLSVGKRVLRPGGNLLIKVFHGEGLKGFQGQLKQVFDKVETRKPEASKSRSAEIYLLALRYGV